MIVKVKYFDIEKYEADWQKYYKDEETIHTNRLMSPTDKGFSPYLKEVEIETEIFIKQDLTNKQPSVFNQIVEIDNDYLYHDNVGYYYISHIHTLRVLNEYYTKYKNISSLVDLTNGLFAQIERELKLKTIIDD
jgi:hypothetical protein